MAKARAEVLASTVGGPFVVLWYRDGVLEEVETGVANAGAAIDLVKTKTAALPGTFRNATIQVYTA